MSTNRIANTILLLTTTVYQAIREFIGLHRAERGGMLGRDHDGVVRHFAPDPTARCNGGAYDPDLAAMNKQIKTWKRQGIEFCGFAHSHPPNVKRPSPHDVWYAGEILPWFKKLDLLWLPIIMTEPDTGKFEILPYAAQPHPQDRKPIKIMNAGLQVLDEWSAIQLLPHGGGVPAAHAFAKPGSTAPAVSCVYGVRKDSHTWRYYGNFRSLWDSSPANPIRVQTSVPQGTKAESDVQRAAEFQRNQQLARLTGSHDLDRHDTTRLCFVGTGGGKSLVPRQISIDGLGHFESPMLPHDRKSFLDKEIHDGQEVCRHFE